MWENIILTATNFAQAEVFESQLQRLRRAKVLDPEVRTWVIPDPDGQRIGSGGATFNALASCFPKGVDFDQKTLILHSGGDSQRIPHQSLQGKIFASLPAPEFSVFESIYQVLSQIGQQLESGIVVACGDTPLRFSGQPQLPSQDFDILGVGYLAGLDLGTRHGVYQTEKSGFSKPQILHQVKSVWQKASTDLLKRFCNTDHQVIIDTGVLIFQGRSIDQLQNWTMEYNPGTFVDLYSQLLPQLIASPFIDFRAWIPEQLQFFHSGTTREYFDFINNSKQTVKFAVPLSEPADSWVEISYNVDDNPKKVDDQATLFGQSIYQWLRVNSHSATSIWPHEEEHSLWNAQLFPVHREIQDDNLGLSADIAFPNWYLDPDDNWLKSKRLSIREVMKLADRHKIFKNEQKIEAEALASRITDRIGSDSDFRSDLNQILTPEGSHVLIDRLSKQLTEVENPLYQARLHKVISDLSDKMEDDKLKKQHLELAFRKIAQSVSESMVLDQENSSFKKNQFSNSKTITVKLPVRIDLAGGWTDTPPYSLERGGAVVNMALLLNGDYPIQVQARWLNQRIVRFRSTDQDQQLEITDFDELHNRPRIGNALALPHAVLLAGDILSVLNISKTMGLEITTSCNVPMGSGLGTSSILAAGCVIATWELMEREWSQEELFNQVLYVEQVLGSGGGWQDQVGGIVGGVKLTTTEAGIPQHFSVQQLALVGSFAQILQERMILAYTGEQRIAKNILELVVADWLSRRVDLVETLNNLRTDAYQMAMEIQKGDVDKFSQLLVNYFEGKKVLNPQTTNPQINRLINPDYCLAWNIAGAGGGGFLILLAKDVDSRRLMEQYLIDYSATIYNWDFANGYVVDSLP